MPRAARPGHGPRAANVPLSWIMLALLVIVVVGWLELRRFEAGLAERASKQWEAELSQHEEQGYPSFKTALKSGPQSSSAMCAALLEAAGILPDAQGRRIGVQSEQRQGAAGAAQDAEGAAAGGSAAAAGGLVAGAGSAAALRYLHSRRQLYDAMEAALLERGLALDASSTQGMGLGDMFRREGGKLKPVLRQLEVPVRAVVLPLADRQASRVLEAAVCTHLLPLLPPGGLWQQDASMYHSTIYHASTHLDPVPATPAQVDAEEAAIRAVGTSTCPLHVVLERVVVTPGGAVLACWQVAGGTEVAELRRQLAAALPGASQKQVVNDATILHTTLARLVAPPQLDGSSGSGNSNSAGSGGSQQAQQARQGAATAAAAGGAQAAAAAAAEEAAVLLKAAVDQMTQELCGLQAELPELWFAEEYDKLALALGGRFRKRAVPLHCAGQGQGQGLDAAATADAAAAQERRRL